LDLGSNPLQETFYQTCPHKEIASIMHQLQIFEARNPPKIAISLANAKTTTLRQPRRAKVMPAIKYVASPVRQCQENKKATAIPFIHKIISGNKPRERGDSPKVVVIRYKC
jgi:hypothetical protein